MRFSRMQKAQLADLPGCTAWPAGGEWKGNGRMIAKQGSQEGGLLHHRANDDQAGERVQ